MKNPTICDEIRPKSNKLYLFILYIIVFLIMFLLIFSLKQAGSTALALDGEVSTEFNPRLIEFKTEDGTFKPSKINYEVSKPRSEILKSLEKRKRAMTFAISNGFSVEGAISYSFPELSETIFKIEQKLYRREVEPSLAAVENSGMVFIKNAILGRKLDKNALFSQLFNKLMNFSNQQTSIEVSTTAINPKTKEGELKKFLNLKGSFSTSFQSSSAERKNNIMVALKSLDGKVVEPGQSFSFNTATGQRDQDHGYKKAKIIKGGVFVNEFGGGVCQVSTTLYNAALLAGLEIKEVHPHSLPVSYVMPCFDAMVNSGSSDLVIYNNSNGPIIIATSSKDDSCLVNIYGTKNIYQIVRKSEKIEDLLQFNTIITKDYKAFGLPSALGKGESKIVGNYKPGYKAVGKLEYYKDGVLVKTETIRENTYNPTKQVILTG